MFSGNDYVVRGKQGKGGVHVVKTNQVCSWKSRKAFVKIKSGLLNVFRALLVKFSSLQAVILGLYEEPMQPAQAATVTESLGDYLKGVGY